MKKLFLLIATSMAVMPSFGQNQSSVVFLPELNTGDLMAEPLRDARTTGSSNRTTAGGTAWFSYTDIMVGSNSKGYYNNVAPDSNIRYMGNTALRNVSIHGMGQCFDPTDSAFFAFSSSAGSPQTVAAIPPFVVTRGNAYSIDSIRFESKYIRNQNSDDTMYVQVVKGKMGTNPFGIYSLNMTNSGRRFVTPMYDPATNLLSDSIDAAAGKQTIKIVMDQAFKNDSTATGGYSNITRNGLKLPTPISLVAGEIVIAYVTIAKQNTDTLHTPLDNTNLMRLYSFDVKGQDAEPVQNKNSVQAGLLANNQIKYNAPPDDWNWQGHKILIPSVAYESDGFMTDFGFRLTCPTCPELSVGDITGNITATTAFPNPASSEVHVRFALKSATDVKINLTNAVGQVVKSESLKNSKQGDVTFNTSDLVNGVYFYTVEANGQRTTNKITIAH